MGDFNPRPREEGDGRLASHTKHIKHFNPRPREEGDPYAVCGTDTGADFNPRPREEGDRILILTRSLFSLFQSTPS